MLGSCLVKLVNIVQRNLTRGMCGAGGVGGVPGSAKMLCFLMCSLFCCCSCTVFCQANDAYLQMAIGNAPWPIGVTMVGIHARTGREKIFSKHVAHVLNDETQRKYIQVTLGLEIQLIGF